MWEETGAPGVNPRHHSKSSQKKRSIHLLVWPEWKPRAPWHHGITLQLSKALREMISPLRASCCLLKVSFFIFIGAHFPSWAFSFSRVLYEGRHSAGSWRLWSTFSESHSPWSVLRSSWVAEQRFLGSGLRSLLECSSKFVPFRAFSPAPPGLLAECCFGWLEIFSLTSSTSNLPKKHSDFEVLVENHSFFSHSFLL